MTTSILNLWCKDVSLLVQPTRQPLFRNTHFSILFALLSLLILPVAAQAQFDCTTNRGIITITGYSGQGGDVNIPSTLNGLTVGGIGNSAFYNCTTLTSLLIPSSVTDIGDNVFSGCTNLQSIEVNTLNANYSSEDGVLLNKNQTTLIQCPGGKSGSYTVPSSVTKIGDYAFYESASLTEVVIPNSVLSIGNSAFYENVSLENITISDSVTSIGSAAFFGCSSLAGITIPNSVTSIGQGAFSDCTSLEALVIPSSVSSIGSDMFSGCTNLKSITIPNGIVSIGTYAFLGCTSLSKVTIPNSVTSIGYEAFYNCTSLANVTIPNTITKIGDYVFSGCSSLNSVTIPLSVTSIGNYTFSGCTRLTSIQIPKKVTKIGDYAFSGCTSLISFSATNSVTSIGSGAFSGCTNLPQITIPTTVTAINNGTFSGCIHLTSVTIPKSVKSIGNYAFSDCTSLAGITIPTSVKSIGNDVFSGCTQLAHIVIPSSVITLGNEAFLNCSSLINAKIPSSIKTIGNSVFAGCVSLTNTIIPASVTSIGGYAFSGCAKLTFESIPASVATIGNNAFSGCVGLTNVVMAAGTKSIGDSAFSGCTSLASVTLPTKITSTGNYLFQGCVHLTSITIPSSVTRIGDYAFSGCSNLINVTLPTTITSIGSGAFLGCANLTTITIPRNVTSIGYEAFSGCTGLVSVCFTGNAPSSLDSDVFLGATHATIYYYTGATGWSSDLGDQPTELVSVPLIIQAPTNQFALLGGKAVFQVAVFGPLTIKYQWQFNGVPITGARSTTLTIPSVQSKNAGIYTVVAANSYGSTTSSPVLLAVKPSVAITVPKANLVVSNSVLAIQGTAAGNFASGHISYRIGTNSTWSTAAGTTAWSGSVTLSPGINWVQAFATDASGYLSSTVSNKVTYVPCALLSVATSGSGTITGPISTKTSTSGLVAISNTVTLTATPGSGQVLVGWSGWTNSSNPAITFTMPEQGLSLTARFIPSPFPAAAGTYRGLITATNSFDMTNSGLLVATLTSGGTFSAKLTFPTESVSASGKLTFYEAQTNVAQARFTSLIGGRSIETSLLFVLDSSASVSGSLTAVGEAAPLAQVEGAMAANTTNFGIYNVAIMPATTNAPSGIGFGSVTLSKTGATLSLTLSDENAVITALASDRLRNGAIPVFTSLYSKKGFLSGWLTISNKQMLSDSALAWHKEAGASASFFATGFSQWADVQGGLYTTVTNLAQWGTNNLFIDDEVVDGVQVHFANATYLNGVLSIPLTNNQQVSTPWTLTSTSGLVKLYGNGLTGTGILVPATAPNPGIFGFATNTISGTGMVHSIYALPVSAQ